MQAFKRVNKIGILTPTQAQKCSENEIFICMKTNDINT